MKAPNLQNLSPALYLSLKSILLEWDHSSAGSFLLGRDQLLWMLIWHNSESHKPWETLSSCWQSVKYLLWGLKLFPQPQQGQASLQNGGNMPLRTLLLSLCGVKWRGFSGVQSLAQTWQKEWSTPAVLVAWFQQHQLLCLPSTEGFLSLGCVQTPQQFPSVVTRAYTHGLTAFAFFPFCSCHPLGGPLAPYLAI